MRTSEDFERPSKETIEAYEQLPPATVHEALGKRGALPSRIKPIYPGMTLCGPALTVECIPGDNLAIHYAVTLAKPGDILMVATGDHVEAGPWGEVLTVAAMSAGIRGLVIDGSVRDVPAIQRLGFPVFSAGVSIKGTQKVLPGRINAPTAVAGVLVNPGDIIVADDDGVAVVPLQEAEQIIELSQKREEDEARLMERIRAGESTVELLALEDALRKAEML